MKRILLFLLALALLSMGCTALAEQSVTMEVYNQARLPIYAADDPYVTLLRGGEAAETDGLSVLVLPVRKGIQINTRIQPQSVRNKRVSLHVDHPELVRVQGNNLTGLAAGETVLTIVSEADETVTLQYRVLVIQPVNRIFLTASAKSVAVGDTLSLTPAYQPENATLRQVKWTSGDERIATVDENGNVTGVKRGNVRIVATAADGSNIRTNISVQVTQPAGEITLDKTEITVDAGRNTMLRATVLPKDANDKNVLWSSSDPSIATVNGQGRVTGVALGTCEIICTSKTNGAVEAKATVHVQQPVKSITFDPTSLVYAGETLQLTWHVEPANATNQALTFSSSNRNILDVSADGTVTGLKAGEAYVNAVSTDGSNRRARVRVKVGQHVQGVHMLRSVAYIDANETSTTGAVLEPKNATNQNMTWRSADPSVCFVEPVNKQSHRVKISGVGYGETVVYGTTEDGGYQTSIRVKVGDYSHATKITDALIDGKGRVEIRVKNVSDLDLTRVTVEITAFDFSDKPVEINTKDGSNVVRATYSKRLTPGKTTPADQWKMKDFDEDAAFMHMTVRVVEYQIDNDWVKTIRRNKQPKFVYNP
ncbi:MAG: Ig-like domain-containing protein [Clostridiales bacterium]|nr:Ig-like domain-containing protein [Clostridiales bacterium]